MRSNNFPTERITEEERERETNGDAKEVIYTIVLSRKSLLYCSGMKNLPTRWSNGIRHIQGQHGKLRLEWVNIAFFHDFD